MGKNIPRSETSNDYSYIPDKIYINGRITDTVILHSSEDKDSRV